jgi:predicted hydrocarbon binding protein
VSALIEFDGALSTRHVGASRLVFHCHHYNLFLQRTVEDALGEEASRSLQRAAAAESARGMLASVFAKESTLAGRLARAKDVFGELGFGLADESALSANGGRVVLVTSHYAVGWRAKFGEVARPACHFAAGYWAGALAAAAGLAPERVVGNETACAAMGAESCLIDIEVR